MITIALLSFPLSIHILLRARQDLEVVSFIQSKKAQHDVSLCHGTELSVHVEMERERELRKRSEGDWPLMSWSNRDQRSGGWRRLQWWCNWVAVDSKIKREERGRRILYF